MKSLTTVLAQNIRVSVIVVGSGALLSFMMVMSTAQLDGRVLDNTIPSHLPIKAKLKKEKEESFKDLKNEKWVREFELEVKNTADRPIYFLHLMLILPEEKAGGNNPLMFPLYYGRTELSDIKTKAEASDVPIKPGDTYVFKIHPGQVPAWDKIVRDWNIKQPRKVELQFQILSFGDGTGYAGSEGVPLPRRNTTPNVGKCGDDPRKEEKQRDVGWGVGSSSVSTGRIINSYLPATFLPVNFLSASFTGASSQTRHLTAVVRV